MLALLTSAEMAQELEALVEGDRLAVEVKLNKAIKTSTANKDSETNTLQ